MNTGAPWPSLDEANARYWRFRRSCTGGLGGQDEGGAPRRGLQLSWLSHPAAPETRHESASRLHLSVQDGACAIKAKVRRLTHRTSPIPPRALLLTRQCGVARMGQLLPVRSVQAHVQLPRLVRMAAGHPLAAPTTQRPAVESPTTSVHAGMGHRHRRRGSAHAVDDQGVPLPLPRNSYSNTLDGDSNRKLYGMNSWRRSTRPPLSSLDERAAQAWFGVDVGRGHWNCHLLPSHGEKPASTRG